MVTIKKKLEKQGYRLIGKHCAVKICRWTKKSLIDEGDCYKSKFYGIKSYGCCQMSPWIECQNKCVHCWRPIEFNFKIKDIINNPKMIIKQSIEQQRKLLTGFKGNKKINMKKFKEAQNPQQFAISLIGEPTLYPKLSELIYELRKQNKTSFLVTNGLNPNLLNKLNKEENLPTQLYISLNSPNEESYNKWHRSKIKNPWKKFNKSLELMKKLKTRRVIRMTLVKGPNNNMKSEYIDDYIKLIKKASPDFIEIKGFVSVGFARNRKGMGYDSMPNYEEIKDFAKKIVKKLKKEKYKILDKHEFSKVVLIGKNKKEMRIRNNKV